ncbi:unnamed protein product [Closterium sp. Naga37s-1]|nr:unnamed protein product [Closterium sp. Naga37s-1]
MAVNAKTTGWFGIGISEIGSMVGSDALVAWVAQSDARAYATDRFIFNKTTEGIVLDDKQDWHVLGGSQTTNQSTGDTWTTVHVWRQLDTGDCNDRPIIPGKLHNIIWAMGATTDVSYHSSDRGASALVLAPAPGPSILAPAPPPSASSSASAASLAAPQQAGKQQQQESMLNFTFTNYRLPTDFTTYRCKVVDIPLKAKTHAVEWGAIRNSTDISAVHHAVIYGCKPKEYANLTARSAGADFDCPHQSDTLCPTTVAVWAVGGRPFTFPPNVGYPIGPGYFTKFVLQVHFTNPKGRADLIDSSGLYLKLAPSLRPMDASIMLTGPASYEYLIRIPPAMPSWTQVSSCASQCTSDVFQNESVKIIGSFLHLHTLGRQLYTDVFRKGSKVATISRQDYYDVASQQTIPVTPEFELLPGDELRTSCVWDSTERTNVTVGGPSPEDEMCIDYLIYYPARRYYYFFPCTGSSRVKGWTSATPAMHPHRKDTLGMDLNSPAFRLHPPPSPPPSIPFPSPVHPPSPPPSFPFPSPIHPPSRPLLEMAACHDLDEQMNVCYDFCASYENDTWSMDPNSPTLSTFYVCGGSNVIPSYKPCKITFGANTPKKVVNGCPAQNHASLADIPSDTISAPLSANAPPVPAAALPPPTAAAAASSPPATALARQHKHQFTVAVPVHWWL